MPALPRIAQTITNRLNHHCLFFSLGQNSGTRGSGKPSGRWLTTNTVAYEVRMLATVPPAQSSTGVNKTQG